MEIESLKKELNELYQDRRNKFDAYHHAVESAKLTGDISKRCKLGVQYSEYLWEFAIKKRELLDYLTPFKELVY